jgi:hypothetical protein
MKLNLIPTGDEYPSLMDVECEAVPRVGDKLTRTLEGNLVTFSVVDVVWATHEDGAPTDIYIVIHPIQS